MCDYSLANVRSRPASVGDKLVVKNFGTGTRGFAGTTENDYDVAICCMPGTELAFDTPVHLYAASPPIAYTTAIFRQINREQPMMHHDCIETPDGKQFLLTYIAEGQRATVLQLPAAPKTEAEAEEQRRIEVAA